MAQRDSWTYMLRIREASPDRIRMDRLGEYLKLFAELLGLENSPVFKGVKNASIGLRAAVPAPRREAVWIRIQEAKYKHKSRAHAQLQKLEHMLGEDSFGSAELRDVQDNVVLLFEAKQPLTMSKMTVRQIGDVDGMVTGLVGADDTMHLHLRDIYDRDIKLIVRSESLARELLERFRRGTVRVRVHGLWTRTELGWVPENNKCTVDSFLVLIDEPLTRIMERLAEVPGNGWRELEDPYGFWRDIRGRH
ncbi:hypothetical protein HGQ62_03765 [Stenotrophomonas maltophilia]|nr:hypothetical protein [Stenotrophomonas maltophilia]NMT72890.1 hypothetical protein [Stenotrophomonas maltophilia]